MLGGQLQGGIKQLRERRSKRVKDDLNLLPKLLGLELVAVPLGEGVSSTEDTVDLVEVTALEVVHHLLEETLPLGGKILTT